uniref:Coiled-coil domain-containing protein 172 n=1 Tax=Amphiprion percula TaxID=161767 RepID=A0A3P8SX46_AMPPE
MSLDTLFQQILLTEQQLAEQTQKFKDLQAQQLSAMKLQHDLMRKSEEQLLKQIEELLCQKSHLEESLAKIKRESKEEEENFLQEISRFNSDFSLQGNRETVFESQTHTELVDLEREVESLYKEMESMSHRNSRLNCMEEERRALLLELKLDRQLSEAEAVTESLRLESQFVSQKPLTDSTCLLRKELETHKEAELERLREALSSEIQLL